MNIDEKEEYALVSMSIELKNLIRDWIRKYKDDTFNEGFDLTGAIVSALLEGVDFTEESLHFDNHDFMTRFIINARLQKWGEKVVKRNKKANG